MRSILVLLAVLVLCYAVALLWYVGADPQSGIHCLLRGGTSKGPQIAVDEALKYVGDKPRSGDRITAVGGESVPTFVHFHRRFAQIARGGPSAAAELLSDGHLRSANLDLPPVVDTTSGRWIRIDFLRNETNPQVAWVRLRLPPTSSLLVAWAWFGLELLIFGIGALVVWRRPGDVSAT